LQVIENRLPKIKLKELIDLVAYFFQFYEAKMRYSFSGLAKDVNFLRPVDVLMIKEE
jgi:hypothetical protein